MLNWLPSLFIRTNPLQAEFSYSVFVVPIPGDSANVVFRGIDAIIFYITIPIGSLVNFIVREHLHLV